MAGKPCDRCGACDGMHEHQEYSDDYGIGGIGNDDGDDNPQVPAMCMEVHVAFGLVSWLCHDCRKEYHRVAKSHPLNKDYGEAALRLEFWKARVGPETPQDAIDEGLKLWRITEELELKINEFANHWLISDPDEVRAN